MIQIKTIAMILLVAIATVGAIGTVWGPTQQAHAAVTFNQHFDGITLTHKQQSSSVSEGNTHNTDTQLL
jgi:hypothetical protein